MSFHGGEIKPKMFTLRSSDGQLFNVGEQVVQQLEAINCLLEETYLDDAPVTLHNVTGYVLAKIIDFLQKHTCAGETNLSDWDKEYARVNKKIIIDIMLAAHYLNISSLYSLTCQTVADMMKGKTPEQVRRMFNIVNDYTPEEESQLRKENRRFRDAEFVLDFEDICVIDSKTKSITRAKVLVTIPEGKNRARRRDLLIIRDGGNSFKIIDKSLSDDPTSVIEREEWVKSRQEIENHLRKLRDFSVSNWF